MPEIESELLVITGCNSAFILRGQRNTLHVKLEGIAEQRAKRASEPAGTPLDRAVKRRRPGPTAALAAVRSPP